MTEHSCDNDICKLLNPCIDELLPYEEVIRRLTRMSSPLDLLTWANQHMIYQLPNKEFIHGLANKIRDIGPETILEIAAGRGVTSRHISKILNKKIILTDSYEWWKYIHDYEKEYSDILKRNYIEAIEEFKPDLIIASWIPYNESWTNDFRKYPFVKGYIIIGEGIGGATGSEEDWITDWDIEHLDDIDKYGICKTDYGFSMKDSLFHIRHTKTAYFKRPLI